MPRRTNLKNWVVILVFLLAMVSMAAGRVIYVDAGATGANNGSSWTDAYRYLQDALAATQWGDEIRAAQGIYKPDQGVGVTPSDRTATFQLNNGVTIKGGYAGFGEPDPNARDTDEYETILSGDLNGNDADVNDPHDLLTEPARGENSYHVVTGSRTDETTVLDGFTITGGNADGSSPYNYGGGMYSRGSGSSPTVSNCTFRRNSANSEGGGMYNYASTPAVVNSTFSGNSAGVGGGIHNGDSSHATLLNCTFSGNSAGVGGGMRN